MKVAVLSLFARDFDVTESQCGIEGRGGSSLVVFIVLKTAPLLCEEVVVKICLKSKNYFFDCC